MVDLRMYQLTFFFFFFALLLLVALFLKLGPMRAKKASGIPAVIS
jgi:hypothetical protein